MTALCKEAHREIFGQIEALDLHLVEPRFECQFRAHEIGKFLQSKKIKAGRIWALPQSDGEKILSPLRDEQGRRFPAIVRDQDENGKLVLREVPGKPLEWGFHVAACDIDRHYDPVVYDPALFSGPVSIWRWMAAYAKEKPPVFIRTSWHTGPRYDYMGSTYAPEMAHEHGLDDNQRAVLDLKLLRLCSPNGIAYRRLNPAWHQEEKN